jgi:hypothetical protein
MLNCCLRPRKNLAPPSANTFEHVCRSSRHVDESTCACTRVFMTWVFICICMDATIHMYIYIYIYTHTCSYLYTHMRASEEHASKISTQWHEWVCTGLQVYDMHVDIGLHTPKCILQYRWHIGTKHVYWEHAHVYMHASSHGYVSMSSTHLRCCPLNTLYMYVAWMHLCVCIHMRINWLPSMSCTSTDDSGWRPIIQITIYDGGRWWTRTEDEKGAGGQRQGCLWRRWC